MAKLDTAAKTGDREQIKTAVDAAGKSRMARHDDFRNKDWSAN